MKILFIGDIFGSIGRELIENQLYQLKKQHQIDFIIANGENAAHGKGITHRIYDELIREGIRSRCRCCYNGKSYLRKKRTI